MKLKLFGGITAILLLTLATASAQLTSTTIATSSTVNAIRSDLNLNWLTSNTPSFTAGGILFESIPNPLLGDFAVGVGELGEFYAEVSFLGRDSLRPNHFGVSSEGGGFTAPDSITLFFDYTSADFPLTKRLTADAYTVADFWHYRDQVGYTGSFYQDDNLSFRTWQYVDVDANLQYTLFGIDDLRSEQIDFNDGAFLVVTNTVGIALQNPVPEPSTFGLIGAAILVGLIALKKRKSLSGGATPGIVS